MKGLPVCPARNARRKEIGGRKEEEPRYLSLKRACREKGLKVVAALFKRRGDARRVIAEAGIEDLTRFLQPADLASFNDLIAAADLAVNLRYPTLGETSGAVLRVLAAGRATIVSDIGWFAELPDDCVVKIPPGHPAEVDLLSGFIERLLEDADLRRRLGENARAYIAEHHSWERAAEEYVAFLERVLRRPRRHLRAYEVLRDLARELADIGLDPDDRWLLPEIARELAHICLPPDPQPEGKEARR